MSRGLGDVYKRQFFCLPMGFFMGIIHYLYSIETMIKDIMHRKEEIEA